MSHKLCRLRSYLRWSSFGGALYAECKFRHPLELIQICKLLNKELLYFKAILCLILWIVFTTVNTHTYPSTVWVTVRGKYCSEVTLLNLRRVNNSIVSCMVLLLQNVTLFELSVYSFKFSTNCIAQGWVSHNIYITTSFLRIYRYHY